MSFARRLRTTRRGGVLLDVIVLFGVVLVGAFVLYGVGLTFHEILHGAERFFGV
jgi:hypothetical protein